MGALGRGLWFRLSKMGHFFEPCGGCVAFGAEAMQRNERRDRLNNSGIFPSAFHRSTHPHYRLHIRGEDWWFPPAITAFGLQIDAQFHRTLVITGVIFVLAQFGLAWTLFRFRDQGQRGQLLRRQLDHGVCLDSRDDRDVRRTGALRRACLGGSALSGSGAGRVASRSDRPAVPWKFRYAGPDGKWGQTKPELVSASTGNPLGLDPKDPSGKDDVVSPVMYVPAGHEVEIMIRTQDVTHSFYVRELRLKQDAVPGMVIHMHFNATVPGQYEIVCAELCGLGHYRMRSFLNVVSQEEYDKWMSDQEVALQQQ